MSFRYPGAEEEVLSDISFTAEPGKTTAIIGSTGSGKSTLLNLIPRFYDVTEGKITLGGKDIRDISQRDLREELGYVPQKGVLFSGTIGSNIMYGNPNGSEQEMIEAAQVAQAEEFIETKKMCIRDRGYAYAGAFVGRAAYDWSCELTIYLDHNREKCGLGRKLYEALEASLKKMGILNLYACIGYPLSLIHIFLSRVAWQESRLSW